MMGIQMSNNSFFYFLIGFGIFVGINLNVSAQTEIKVHYNCTTPGFFAITFDDGPHPNGTSEVLDVLKELNVTATFFIQGFGSWETNMSRYEGSVKRAFEEGHQIGSHSWSHPEMVNATVDDIRRELRDLENLYMSILGVRPTIFRPPFGSYDQQLLEIAKNEFNYEVIMWNINTDDWVHPGDTDAGMEEYYQAINETWDESYIALHHDVQKGGADLSKTAIQFMQDQNFQLVTIAECIGIENYQ